MSADGFDLHLHRRQADGVDVIGDVHGCYTELTTLLHALGWRIDMTPSGRLQRWASPNAGRRLAFVGDLIHKGPESLAVLQLVRALVTHGVADWVCGNHEKKLATHLQRTEVTGPLPDGLRPDHQRLLEHLQAECRGDARAWAHWRHLLERRPYTTTYRHRHEATLVVVHAALPYADRESTNRKTRDLCLYGEVIGRDEAGRVRHGSTWTTSWPDHGHTVVHGHVAQRHGGSPTQRGATINLDTGCAYGGALSAYRWPEATVVQVPAVATHYHDRAQPMGAGPAD